MAVQDTGSPALVLKILNMMQSLSKSEQVVATYITQHPEEVVYLSVAALAENSGVSDPTVVRACQKLGFTGYQDLKVTLAQDIVTPLQSVHEEVLPDDDMQKIISKVFQGTVHTLEFTHDTLNVADVEHAAKLLMNARRVLIFGLGGSGPIAMDLQHKLLRLGLSANAYTDPHLQAINSVYVGAEDVVFAISHSGSSRSVVDNTRIAKNNGASVISLTSMGHSPLSKIADISLFTASSETRFHIVAISSRIAELTIIDSIYTYIAMRSESVKNLKVEKAMEGMKY